MSALNLAQSLIRIKSISPNDAGCFEIIGPELTNLGFKDGFRLFNKEPKEYTFWDYQQGSWQRNKGLRIDHYLVSDSMIQDLKTIEIDKFTRDNERPSDHVPIRCVLT